MNAPSSRDNPATPHRRSRRVRILVQTGRYLVAATAFAALLVGLPWALACMVGWPLPDHLPTWTEIQGVLLAPLSATFLLDVLACVCWLLWGWFTATVARSAIDIVRHARIPDPRTHGPMRRAATVLVSTILISLISQRTGLATGNSATTSGTGVDVVTAGLSSSAPAVTRPSASFLAAPGAGVPRTVSVASGRWTLIDAAPTDRTGNSVTVRTPDPVTGVHDSLWRIAQRTLGDGDRWPEIFALNKDKPQPGGRTLTRPTLIYPGEQLQLPAGTTAASPDPGVDAEPDSAPESAAETPDQKRPSAAPTPQNPLPRTSSPRESRPTGTPATSRTTHVSDTAPPSAASRAGGDPGLRFGQELFVGVGLVAAVSAALMVARRRQRRRYRPGSGARTDLAIAPVVYQLRLGHLCTEQDRAEHDDPEHDSVNESDVYSANDGIVPVPRGAATPMVLGVRDGREIALDLAAAHGLGLIGAGAAAAVRALVVSAVAATPRSEHSTAKVIVAAEDVAVLCGSASRASRAWRVRPTVLQVVADLDAALDELESEILVRTGASRSPRGGWPPVLLVTSTPTLGRQRLQAILDNGATIGVTGLVLGQWPAGVTAYVRDNGTISITTPGIGEHLRGTRVFHMTADDTADLLSLLHDADPHNGDSQLDQRTSVESEGQATANDRLEIVQAVHVSGPGRAPGPAMLRPPPNVPAATAGRDRCSGPVDTVDVRERADRDPPLSTGLLRISVLGPVRVWCRDTSTARDPTHTHTGMTEHEVTSAFQPRVRELLVFLALHPDGASREALIAALWATSPPERTTNAMNTSISRLRRALAAATGNVESDLVVVGEGRYRLDPELVEVDYHHFADAVAARRAAVTDADRVEAYRRIVDSYTGPLADGLSTDWIETARETIRRDAIDAVAALARALVGDDPQQTLDLLEIARAFDPHNELIYRDIMRLQDRLGQLDAIPRTLTLLTTRLAEIDDRPTHQAVDLADRLRRRHDVPGEPGRADRGHSRAG